VIAASVTTNEARELNAQIQAVKVSGRAKRARGRREASGGLKFFWGRACGTDVDSVLFSVRIATNREALDLSVSRLTLDGAERSTITNWISKEKRWMGWRLLCFTSWLAR